MIKTVFNISEIEQLTADVFRMRLLGNTEGIKPGQFVNISLPGLFLRRPISVCDCEEGMLTIVFKVVGKGTALMAGMQTGVELELLTGLGNGYDLSASGDKPLLLGGGVGVPPMYKLAKELRSQGKDVQVVLGFNTASEIFMEDDFKALGCHVVVTTADGSYGVKGFVTNALPELYTYFYCCGPLPMLRAVEAACVTDGEMSYEERMGCGFGVCVGCTVQTIHGNKRVCKDGPVFKKGEIVAPSK